MIRNMVTESFTGQTEEVIEAIGLMASRTEEEFIEEAMVSKERENGMMGKK